MKRLLGVVDQLDQPSNVIIGSINGARSHKRIGAPTRSSQHPTPPNNALVVFRVIIITFILLCLIWGYFLIKIATDVNNTPLAQPTARLAKPETLIDVPLNVKARVGWLIRQKIDHIRNKIQHAPLLDVERMDSPIIIFTYNRADYLERTLWKVFEYHPAQKVQQKLESGLLRSGNDNQKKSYGRIVGSPIIISQDGHDNPGVTAVIETYREIFEMKLGVPLYRMEHPRESTVNTDTSSWDYDWSTPYKLLAAHYGWALSQTFSGNVYSSKDHYQKHNRAIPTPPNPQRVIVLEEDIEISRDFFSLMNATADLLDTDDTLLAVSAFNDNGKEQFVADTKRLVRSDFFPGLGWMMSRTVWDGPRSSSRPNKSGLKTNWAPGGYWDDWLRENENRWGRHIIRPEVSRTFHFGNVHGTSDGENNNMLNRIELEENDVHWEKIDLSYLDVSRYANEYWDRVSSAQVVTSADDAKRLVAHRDVRLVYKHFDEFRSLASDLDMMQDEKAGVPRTGFEGIVEIRYGRGKYFIYVTSLYVEEGGEKPTFFGEKAWLELSKASLMQDLGIEDIPIPTYEDAPNDWGNWDNMWNQDEKGWNE